MPFPSACCMGKIRLPSQSSQTVYKSPLELLYSGLWGPSPMISHSGFRYYMSFVDTNTHVTWLYLLKNKSDTLTVFRQFKSMVELQLDKHIKALQTDWGRRVLYFFLLP